MLCIYIWRSQFFAQIEQKHPFSFCIIPDLGYIEDAIL